VSASPDLRERLAGPVLEAAPRVLNAVLRRGEVAVRITEVEAYAGPDDPGSHAYRGPTRRNAVMFGPAGRLYCYFTYGMHVCCNVTVGPDDSASAVLLRAGEVIEGTAAARQRRGSASDRDLARGPARLCNALGIELTDNGTDLSTGPITLELGPPPAEVVRGPRVGLRGAPDRPWRFWIAGDPTVSVYRRHRLAPPTS
jgi:DNA-3-methyladenine glycosylase